MNHQTVIHIHIGIALRRDVINVLVYERNKSCRIYFNFINTNNINIKKIYTV